MVIGRNVVIGMRSWLFFLEYDTSTFQFALFVVYSVLDDKELFEDQKYFPLNDLKSLTNFLNNLVFTCLWDHALTKSHTSSSTSSLISSCVALLSLLLRRNRRMPFMTDVDLQVKYVCNLSSSADRDVIPISRITWSIPFI